MTKNEIKAFVEQEVKRQLAASPRVIPKQPEKLKKAVHRPIESNQPEG